MRNITVTDDFGRRTTFIGDKLVAESTDMSDGRKPQWLEVNIWRTRGGHFVVQRRTMYRVRHLNDRCPRAEGYELLKPTSLDTYTCPACNPDRTAEGDGYAQAPRISVEAYYNPQSLIDSFQMDGRYNLLARSILSELADQDDRIDNLWSEVAIP